MPADTLSLAGKVAIVTGSGRENGIGAGVATALARNGCAVALNYVSNSSAARANTLADMLAADGAQVTVIKASVASPEGAKRLAQETLKTFATEQIHILVNNAGIVRAGDTLEVSPEDITTTFDTNVKGAILVSQAVVPHMPPGGRIINISSTASKLGLDTLSVYGASKAALDSLTYSWAKEWGRSRGITVNALAPGPVLTDIIVPEMADEILGPHIDLTRAAHRVGTIEDLGDAVLLLASEKSRWITGQYISVSGGTTGP